MAFNYKKYKEAQFKSPLEESKAKKTTKTSKVLKRLNKVRKGLAITPAGAGWLALEMGLEGLYDFDFLGFKSYVNRDRSKQTSTSKTETTEQKANREAKEGKVVKGGTQRFLGEI